MKKKSELQLAQEKAQKAINKTNEKIEELGTNTSNLYGALTIIQELFDKIRNVPTEKKLQYEELKQIRLNWKQQAEKIEKDYTDAALAWLGGGALAAGGGGMAVGEAFLALAGPVGWAIAGVALITSGIFFWKTKSDQKHIEDVFKAISERDVKSYSLAIVELNERIGRIIDENEKLNDAIRRIETFGLNYKKMTEEQQYALGSYVNLMLSSTQLLINPIIGLQPKYSERDFDDFITKKDKVADTELCREYKSFIVSLANFLYKIDLNDRDKKLLWKSLRKNKKMLKSINVSKKEFGIEIIDAVLEALKYSQRN